MRNRRYVVIGLVAFLFGVMVFIGCAKPPTEEVTALQSDLKNCENQGAKVFAADQYGKVTQKMAELQNLMDQKKFRQATALADSLSADMTVLVSATASNGKKVAKMNIVNVYDELGKLKSLLTPETIKVLGEAESKPFQDMSTGFEGQVSTLNTDLDNYTFMKVYNDSQTLKNNITKTIQSVNEKLEAAKAKQMEKASKAKPKAKPVTKPSPTKK